MVHTPSPRTFEFLSEVCRDGGLTSADKLVAFVLLRHFDEQADITCIGRTQIADEVHVSRRNVTNSISRLETNGWFAVERNHLMKNTYRPLWDRLGSPRQHRAA